MIRTCLNAEQDGRLNHPFGGPFNCHGQLWFGATNPVEDVVEMGGRSSSPLGNFRDGLPGCEEMVLESHIFNV